MTRYRYILFMAALVAAFVFLAFAGLCCEKS